MSTSPGVLLYSSGAGDFMGYPGLTRSERMYVGEIPDESYHPHDPESMCTIECIDFEEEKKEEICQKTIQR